MSSRAMPVAVCLVWLLVPQATVRAAGGPVFHLSFEKGLTPDIGPAEECKWVEHYTGKATEPPRFCENGLTGRALLVENKPPHCPLYSCSTGDR